MEESLCKWSVEQKYTGFSKGTFFIINGYNIVKMKGYVLTKNWGLGRAWMVLPYRLGPSKGRGDPNSLYRTNTIIPRGGYSHDISHSGSVRGQLGHEGQSIHQRVAPSQRDQSKPGGLHHQNHLIFQAWEGSYPKRGRIHSWVGLVTKFTGRDDV